MSATDALRVLIVEDDAELLEWLWLALRREGYDVETAADGLEGVEKARLTHFDVAIVDLGLPRLEGHSLGAALKAIDPSTGVIALTGDGRPTARQKSLRVGFDAHLVKPASLDDLRRTIESLRSVDVAAE